MKTKLLLVLAVITILVNLLFEVDLSVEDVNSSNFQKSLK